VVEGCGDADAELMLQQGVTSLEDLANLPAEMLTVLPGIDEAGASAIKARAAELAIERKRREEEDARLALERAAQEAAAAAAEAAAAREAEAAQEGAAVQAADAAGAAPADGETVEAGGSQS
jgi:hypothetical protein